MNCDIVNVKITDCNTSTFVKMNIINHSNPTPRLMRELSLGDDSIYDVMRLTDINHFVVLKSYSDIDENMMRLIYKYYTDNGMDFNSYPLFYIQNSLYMNLDEVKAKLVYYGFQTADHLFKEEHLSFLVKTSKDTHIKMCKAKYFNNHI